MGLLSGLIVGPCLAPPLAGALLFISQHADPLLGGGGIICHEYWHGYSAADYRHFRRQFTAACRRLGVKYQSGVWRIAGSAGHLDVVAGDSGRTDAGIMGRFVDDLRCLSGRFGNAGY